MRKILTHPLILCLLILTAFMILKNQEFLAPIQKGIFFITSPSQGFFYQTSLKINGFLDFVSSINQLDQENKKLKDENRFLLSRLAHFQEIERENQFLYQQLNLNDSEPKELILANVIGQDFSGASRFLLINKGSQDKVFEKGVIITAGDILVGEIIETADSFSKVRLITDPKSKVNILIQESGITGLIKGDQDLDLSIDLLPQGESIEENQTIVTSGLAGVFPSGLLVGQIKKVISSDVSISQMAKVKPAADLYRLEKVFIIK